ncbi:MAG: hypothetical protein FIA99_19045 [Ruminiclostridium sp.]|nr:hypothetical protein [Ruminiclostridium sp.]
MKVTVNLWSKKTGEIKRFLEKYYGKAVYMDEDVDNWIYVYNKPIDAVDIISAVIDNNDKYQILIFIQVDEGDIHPITFENHNDVIKGIFYLCYEENTEHSCYI